MTTLARLSFWISAEQIDAFEAAEHEGRAAIVYEGEHIDYAHVATAREVLAMARELAT